MFTRVATLIVCLTALTAHSIADVDKTKLAALDGLINTYVEEGKLAGAVIRIGHKGRVVKLTAYGNRDREASAPMQTDTIFRIASQSKAIISVGVMILQERGLLLIDDPIHQYLPEFKNSTVAVKADNPAGFEAVPTTRPITIRDLLTHTAGIDYGNGPGKSLWEEAGIQGWYFGHRDEPIRETVRRMAALPMAAQPRSRFVYGYNTDILGALVEVVSEAPLDTFLDRNIFGPLGMDDTHFYLPVSKRERLATVYSASADASPVTRTPALSAMVGQGAYVDGPRKSFSGGAGLLSTANDYGRFLDMLQGSGSLGRVQVLSPKTVELMTVDHIDGVPYRGGNGFGLGFNVLEDLGSAGTPGSVGTFGWGGAYHTVYWVDPIEDITVSYMTQLLPAGRIDDHNKLRVLIYQAIK